MSEQFLDCVGVPEFYATHLGAMEDAGAGMIRFVRCISRSGMLIPVFSCVTPAIGLVTDLCAVREFAKKVACENCVVRQ